MINTVILIIPPIFAMVLLISYFITPRIAKLMEKHGIVGIDVHKPHKPVLPEACGLSVLIAANIGLMIMLFFDPDSINKILALILSSTYAGFIGLLDNVRKLDAKTKTLLTVLAIIPIVVLEVYVPRPRFPFIGITRLTLVYLVIMPLALAVTSNATNMIDVYNGVMVGMMSISFTSLLVASTIGYFKGYLTLFPIYSSAIIIAAFLGYFPYNKYPARVFNGDVGSLYAGAYYGALAIIGRLEIIAVTAFMPQIMNGFNILTTIKGLKERREIKLRPVIVDEAGLIHVMKNEAAPMTIAHLLTLKGPLTEKELIRGYWLLSAVAAILAIIISILVFT